jgi:hypothetical protein
MGNGAIGPFRGDPDDPTALDQEEKNRLTVKRYYERVWEQDDVDAIDDLVTNTFALHREGKVLRGKAALKAQVNESKLKFFDLRVQVEDIVALRGEVACRLNVWRRTQLDAGDWKRTRGLDLSRVEAGRITASAVTYQPEETVPPGEAIPPAPKKRSQ